MKRVVTSRTSLVKACESVLQTLVKEEKPYSISGLAKDTKLHRQTVEKCVHLLFRLETKWLENYKIKMIEVDKKRIVALERRVGLLSYPEHIQQMILRTAHFTLPSVETQLVVNLYLKNAISAETGIPVGNDPIVTRLVKQGQLMKSGNKMYLSDEGITVAKGALKIFPFLEKYKTEKQK